MIPHYYEDPHTLHVGTMPNRAYYIPASRRSDALVEHRETSDRFQLLNGSWKFRYYASIYDLQDAFYEVGYDASAFDSIPVPSVWQNHGYDHHQYTNIRYPFPADPPYVPKENPCGAYLYDFTYQKDAAAPRAFLNFEGVASCVRCVFHGACAAVAALSAGGLRLIAPLRAAAWIFRAHERRAVAPLLARRFSFLCGAARLGRTERPLPDAQRARGHSPLRAVLSQGKGAASAAVAAPCPACAAGSVSLTLTAPPL